MTNNTVGHNGRLFHINMVNQILYHNLELLKWKKYEEQRMNFIMKTGPRDCDIRIPLL